MLLCIMYAMLFVDTVDMKIKACNALNAMFVNTGVCGFYTTLYRVMRCGNCTLYKVASCPCKREGYLKSLPSCGFSCSLVQGGSFVKRYLSCIDSVNIDSIECIRDPCLVLTVSTYIVLMVWLKSPQSQHFKTFFQIENWLNIKKVMSRNVWMYFVSIVST